MRVLIDTNIYLNFYRLKNDQSLKLIDVLIKLVRTKKIEIVTTHQIKDEFYRDKIAVFKEYLSTLDKTLGKGLRIPKFIELNKKSKDIITLYKKTHKALDAFKKEYQNRVLNPNSQVNKKIALLFKLCEIAEDDNEVIQPAYYRTIKGNPPRKGNRSFGDAIIWETILKYYSDKDLVLISGDGDFETDFNNGEINDFLLDEFHQIKGKNVKLYKTLSEFINKITKKQTIAKTTVTEEREINTLSNIHLDSGMLTVGRLNQNIISANDAILSSGVVNIQRENDLYESLGYVVDFSNNADMGGKLLSTPLSNMNFINSNSVSFFPRCGHCKKDIYITGAEYCPNCGNKLQIL
jgi:hypothetical protein